jgi:ubiquinone/menaquinone biosynthesis C-methylase UbiE
MSFKSIARFGLLRGILRRLAEWRVAEKLVQLAPFLRPGDSILDVGAGNCVLCDALRSRRYDVTPIDVADESFVASVKPLLYDGRRLPFPADCFDVALLITVLHHARAPDDLVAEASRVARRIVIIEEIYSSRLRKYVTYLVDSVFNLEFRGHPRNNRTDEGWKRCFDDLRLRLTGAVYSTSLGLLQRVTYSLERGGA